MLSEDGVQSPKVADGHVVMQAHDPRFQGGQMTFCV